MMQATFARSAYGAQRTAAHTDKIAGVTVAILLHVVVILMLLQYAPARTALVNAVPLMVSLITPEGPKPEVLPKPLPVKQQHVPAPRVALPQPVLAAPSDAPATMVAPQAPPAPPADPTPAPVVAAVLPVAPPATAPAPVTPPNFSAAYLNNPAPAYPTISRRQGQQGKVVLRVFVNAGGAADQVEVRTSSGHATLDRAALDAVRRWRFIPARQGDQPVAAWVLVPITFTLEG